MKLFLQTSSGQPTLVLWDDAVIFEANYGKMQRLDYGAELTIALHKTNRSKTEIDGIIVDTGPGRLGSTRTAVAFANGLGFALGVPLIPVNSVLLLGVYAESIHSRPCLVLRSAARQQYHWALVQGGKITEAGFAPDAVITPSYSGPIAIAGDASPERATLQGLSDVKWLELNAVPGAALSCLGSHLQPASGPVVPLVDTAGLIPHG